MPYENIIYLLLNREKKQLYIGETMQSLSQRYPKLKSYTEYAIIQLPPETSNHTRKLIEHILIATGVKLFENNLSEEPSVLNKATNLKLMNKKK